MPYHVNGLFASLLEFDCLMKGEIFACESWSSFEERKPPCCLVSLIIFTTRNEREKALRFSGKSNREFAEASGDDKKYMQYNRK